MAKQSKGGAWQRDAKAWRGKAMLCKGNAKAWQREAMAKQSSAKQRHGVAKHSQGGAKAKRSAARQRQSKGTASQSNISAESVVNLLAAAGFAVGLGEDRPDKSGGSFGQWEVK